LPLSARLKPRLREQHQGQMEIPPSFHALRRRYPSRRLLWECRAPSCRRGLWTAPRLLPRSSMRDASSWGYRPAWSGSKSVSEALQTAWRVGIRSSSVALRVTGKDMNNREAAAVAVPRLSPSPGSRRLPALTDSSFDCDYRRAARSRAAFIQAASFFPARSAALAYRSSRSGDSRSSYRSVSGFSMGGRPGGRFGLSINNYSPYK
jgi:hypothetical protein